MKGYIRQATDEHRNVRHAGPGVPPRGTQELFTKFGTRPKLELSSSRGRAVRREPHDSETSPDRFRLCGRFLGQSCITPLIRTRVIILGACAPSPMTPPNRLWSWIASLIKRKASIRPAHAFDVHSVVGRPTRTIAGLVPAATSGIRLIGEESVSCLSSTADFNTMPFLYRSSPHSDWYGIRMTLSEHRFKIGDSRRSMKATLP